MTGRLLVVSGWQVVVVLGRADCAQVSTKGSHVKLRHPDGRTVILPLHDTLARGTLSSILRQADVDADDLAGPVR